MNRKPSKRVNFVGVALATLLFCLPSFLLQAQYTSRLGKFQVDQIRGCSPFTVTIMSTNLTTTGECTTSKPCNFDYGSGKGQQQGQVPADFVFTYTTPGTFKLSVVYQSATADDIIITVDPDIKPEFEIYSCNDNSVSVKIIDENYDTYDFDFGDGAAITKLMAKNAVARYTLSGQKVITVQGKKNNGAYCSPSKTFFQAGRELPKVELTSIKSVDRKNVEIEFTPFDNIQYRLEIATNGVSGFQQLPKPSETGTYSATVGDLDQEFYCFRIQAFDVCIGAASDEAYSQILCTQQVKLDIQSGLNTITWKSNTTGLENNDEAVSIYRNDKPYSGGAYNPTTFEDPVPNIDCNTDYSYYVVFNYPNGATSTSLKKSGKSFFTLTPDAIANVSAVTENQSVNLTWIEPPKDPILSSVLSPNTYSVYKNINKSNYLLAPSGEIPASKPPKLNYLDNTYSELTTTCYKINYADRCGNKTKDEEAIEVCPVVLNGSIDKKNSISLVWNDYRGWQNGVSTYQVDKFAADGTLLTSTRTKTTNFIDDTQDLTNQIVSYKITALATEGDLAPSTSNLVTIIKESNLFYPTAFTPNGDKLNDNFGVSGQFIDKMDLKIYDRWGGLIFSTEKNEPWNGYYNGKQANEGAYIWKAVITDQTGKTSSYTGSVLLLKR
jgi:gliding motility-associated-like protein